MTFPRLYAITDGRSATSHVEQVRQFLDGGARLIQIRDKTASGRELFDIAAAVLERTRQAGAALILNDRVDVALAVGADGVHVGQDDLPAEAARRVLGAGKIVGVSTHTIEQFREALVLPVDYVAVGPIFATATKEDANPVVGLDLLRAARAISNRPIVAIGGITLAAASAVLAAGASSVAVVGDLHSGLSIPARVSEYVASIGL